MDEDTYQPEDPQSEETPPKLAFPDLLKWIFVDFVGFSRRCLTSAPPPLMYMAMWLIGMDAMAGGIELAYISGQQYLVDNWFYAWLRIMGGGAAMGIMRYWLVGSIFHIVVVAAGGRGLARTSRYILLYALVPAAVCNLSVKILQMLMYGNKYFTGQTNAVVEGFFGMVMMAAYVFTIVLCYRGMRTLQQTDKRRSILVLVGLSFGMIILATIAMGI
jgi:hypothetical protein